jgi:hypothetical protein
MEIIHAGIPKASPHQTLAYENLPQHPAKHSYSSHHQFKCLCHCQRITPFQLARNSSFPGKFGSSGLLHPHRKKDKTTRFRGGV